MKRLNDHEKQFPQQFIQYGKNAKEWLRKCAFLLPEIEERRIWKKKGFGSIYEYAAKLAGMSKNSVRESLRVMKHVKDKPELKRVVAEKGVSAVRPVVTLATPKTDKFWAEKATEMSQHTLAAYAQNYRKESHLEVTSQPEELTTVYLSLTPEMARRLERVSKREDFEKQVEKFLDDVESSENVEKPEVAHDCSRHIPAKMDRHARSRTGGKCAFPGCWRKGEVLHHTQRFASERVHDPDRLALLCKAHHEMAHLGLIENENKAPDKWKLLEVADEARAVDWVDNKVQFYRRN